MEGPPPMWHVRRTKHFVTAAPKEWLPPEQEVQSRFSATQVEPCVKVQLSPLVRGSLALRTSGSVICLSMVRPHIYFARATRRRSNYFQYVVYHEYTLPPGGRAMTGLSIEYLAGYVDGVLAVYSAEYLPTNGIPQHLQKYEKFRELTLKPLGAEELKTAFSENGVLLQYPELLDEPSQDEI